MTLFEDVEIETDANALQQAVYDRIRDHIPGWQEFPGNLETFLTEGYSEAVIDARTIASNVPKAVLRYLGASVYNLQPVDAAPASVSSTWTLRDTDGHTIPAGTIVNIPSPSNDDIGFYVVSDVTVANGDDTTATGEVILVAFESGADGNDLSGSPTLGTALDFVDDTGAIALVGSTGSGADAEEDDDYIDRLILHLRTLAPRPILPDDFVAFARDIAGVERALAIDGFQPLHNLLTAQESNAEAGISGWSATTNCAVAQSATQAAEGSNSLRLSSTASGDMDATTPVGASGFPVDVGQVYTFRAECRSGASARTFKTAIRWYDVGASLISESLSTGVTSSTSGFTTDHITATAPALAVYAAVKVKVVGTAAGSELHYFDKMQLRRGATYDYVVGGTPADDNERMITMALADSTGAAVTGGIKTAVEDDLEARREVNFIVNTVDPTSTTIDVAFVATAWVGEDTDDVEAAIITAIESALDPATWGIVPFGDARSWVVKSTVRYGELYSAIMGVEGVRDITSLTLRKGADSYAGSDIIIPGEAPLPTPGTVAGSVTIP